MKNKILTALTLIGCSTAQAVSMSWSSTISSSASRIEAAQNWLAQLEENERGYVFFTPDESDYLESSELLASARMNISENTFSLTYLTFLEQPTSITLNSFDEEMNLSFSRTVSVAPTNIERDGLIRYLYSENFTLTEEELFPFVDQPLKLVARYENFEAIGMEANVSAVPEPGSAFVLGLASLAFINLRARFGRSCLHLSHPAPEHRFRAQP